ncbi:hypothetical protein DRI50_03185 [candidate division KSB1 bacterium]|nr:MAG: hypothetical protein DRI50_03185 [candidate division KSB1 bacterium]
MDVEALIKHKEDEKKQKKYIQFSERELEKLRPDEVEKIIDHFHGSTLVRLPESEVKFFEWLKETDRAVWNDLWEEDEEDESYLVSVDFLREFIRETPSFPICDLIDEPNYWFTFRHIKPEGLEYLQEEIRLKVEMDEDLTLEELFLLEISVSSTDIWHFSHRHQVPVERMKQAIADMVYKGWIVHLTDRDDLVKYLDF